MSIESPLIGSGSQEEVDLRVNALIDLGKSRGFLTYEELNEKLPDEVVSPDKLDNLLMMIDEMGIRLIDEHDVVEFTKSGKRTKSRQPGQPIVAEGPAEAQHVARVKVPHKPAEEERATVEDEDGEELD